MTSVTSEWVTNLSPPITVLIPTFNRADYVGECLESVLGQSLPASQLIVVDDGSTDQTATVLARYGDRITVVRGPNRGKPAALNTGLAFATGDYVWMFDDDDVALPDALERLVAPLIGHPEYGFSYGTFHYTHTDPRSDHIGEVFDQSQVPDVESRGFVLPLLEANFLGGAALFARRSCYEVVGAFDERLIRSQDYDMAIRIARRFTGVRVPDPPIFHYRQHPGQRGTDRHRFDETRRFAKWLEYDQMIFRRLYRELPLASYGAPGYDADLLRRPALLQRLVVVSSKLLVAEALADLNLLAEGDDGVFSPSEQRLVRALIATPFYGPQRVIDDPGFARVLAELARSSPAIRRLRRELSKALLRPRSRRPAKVVVRLTKAMSTVASLHRPLPRNRRQPPSQGQGGSSST